MKPIAIIGAGALGREVLVLIKQINEVKPVWDVIGFFDDHKPLGTKVHDSQVIGSLDSITKHTSELAVVIAIADITPKIKMFEKLHPCNVSFPTLIHPSVSISEYQNIQIGIGCIVTTATLLTCDIIIEDFVLINPGTNLGHDTKVGTFSSIMSACNISGGTQIGESCYLNIGVSTEKNVIIPDNTSVESGSILKTVRNS